jgi:hypothetical protein
MVLLSYFKCICFLFSGRTSGGIDMIYSTELLSTIRDVLLEGDTVKFRVYEVCIGIRVIVFKATFNNISVMLWRSVLLGVPGENHRPATSR